MINSGRFDAAQVYYNAINPSAAWSRVPPGWRGQDFCGVIAACFRQNMGVLNIRVWAGGTLASAKRPDRLFMMTTGTDLDNEMRCAAAVRKVLGDEYGTPAQAALRFVLGNRDLASRVIGIAELDATRRRHSRRCRRDRCRAPPSRSSTNCGRTISGPFDGRR